MHDYNPNLITRNWCIIVNNHTIVVTFPNFNHTLFPANICWSSTRLQRNNFISSKTSWRRFWDVFKTSHKTSWRRLEDVCPRRIYWSWPRRLQDLFWSRKAKANIFVLIKTFWRSLQDVFWRQRWKTTSRRLQDVFIKMNVCWVTTVKNRINSVVYSLPELQCYSSRKEGINCKCLLLCRQNMACLHFSRKFIPSLLIIKI